MKGEYRENYNWNNNQLAGQYSDNQAALPASTRA